MYNPEFGATGGLPAQWARLGHPDLQVKLVCSVCIFLFTFAFDGGLLQIPTI